MNELCDTGGRVSNSDKATVAGGLNGHVGEIQSGYEAVHRGYTFGLRNSKRERSIEFAEK